MHFTFINNCEYTVCISVQGEMHFLPPFLQKTITTNDNNLLFDVNVDNESRCLKKRFTNIYIVNIKSFCSLTSDKDCFINLSYELKAITPNLSYERICASSAENGCYCKEFAAIGTNRIKHAFNKAELVSTLTDPLISFCTDLRWIALCIILAIFFKWRVFIVLLIFYAISVAINLVGIKASDFLFKKLADITTDKEDFYKMIDDKYITEYFNNLH